MATRAKKTTDVSDKVSIPSPVRNSTRKPSATDLLSNLANKVPVASKKEAKKERPELPLSRKTEELFAEFAPVKELFDVVKSKVDKIKGELDEDLFDSWVDSLWNNKTVPINPIIRARDLNGRVDAEGMFIVQEKIKVQIPDNNNPEGSLIDYLINDLGLTLSEAEALVTEEIDFTPQLGLRSFDELVKGSYVDRVLTEATAEEQAVGKKILEFVTNQLTPEEQALVLRNTPKTVVKKGFLDRIVRYAHNRGQLRSLLGVFVPVNYPKGAKFAIQDNPVVKNERLLAKAAEILGGIDGDND